MIRADDPSPKSYFQSDRFFQVNEQWFFYVRETGEQGPFPSKESAQAELHAYLRTQVGITTDAWDVPGATR
jgi:hypothetical protein